MADSNSKAVIIDIDDTILDLGERRFVLAKAHFPQGNLNEELIRKDVRLSFLGARDTSMASGFLKDFSNPDVVKTIQLKAVPGSLEAINVLLGQKIKILLLTSRNKTLREDTVNSLAQIGLTSEKYELFMDEGDSQIDPGNQEKQVTHKSSVIRKLLANNDVIALVGDQYNDISAAVECKIPAILFDIGCVSEKEWENISRSNHVGLEKASSWSEIQFYLGQFLVGNEQMTKLRESFTNQYSSWLHNLNFLCGIDISIAALLSVFLGKVMLDASLSLLSRVSAGLILILTFLAIIFAIRAFTSRFTSGRESNSAIVPESIKHLYNILIDGDKKYKDGDAIDQYIKLREKTPAEQARAHLDFFYDKYKTHNANALLNLRMYEMRSNNYSKAYAEHTSSSLLVGAVTLTFFWLISVAIFDPEFSINSKKTEQIGCANSTTKSPTN